MKKSIFQNMGALSLWLLLFLLTACSTSSSSSASPVQKTSPVGQKNCQPSPITNSNVGPEAQGTSRNAEVWSLIQSTSGMPPAAKSMVKIVWKMTGSGDFHVVALGPSGLSVAPSQGPDIHAGSNWNHPGDEWGSLFTFPVPGCWDLHVTRTNASGDVYLSITNKGSS